VASIVQTELTLPAAMRMQQLVQDYVRGLTRLAGLPEDQRESLSLAFWEACRNAVEHAFDAENPGTLKLSGTLTPTTLVLSLGDQGLPFYQMQGVRDATPDPASPAPVCRGMASVSSCFDEVHWSYHGVEGNELRLTKNLTGVCGPPPPEAEAAGDRLEPAEPAAPETYTVRLLRPGEGLRVAQLIYRVYGYTYPHKDFYYPDRLDHDLATGRLVGVVAVAGDGEFAAHLGMTRWDLGPLGSVGAFMVAPAHRGRGLTKLLGQRLQAEIQTLGLVGLFGEAVTIHTISQQIAVGLGYRVTGLKLSDLELHFNRLPRRDGPSSSWEREADPGLQRQTLVFIFHYLAPPAPKTLFPPPRHREMLTKIYGNLEVETKFLDPTLPTGPGEIKIHFDQVSGVGTIQVNRIGSDTRPKIIQARRDLCDLAGAQVVGLCLPLGQGGAPHLCEAAEADGFFFSGVLPQFAPDGDFLRLQYLNIGLEPESIHLYSPFAKELLTYILREKERVGP